MSGIKLSLGSAHLSKGKAPVRKSAFSALGGDSDDEQEGFPTSSTTKKTNGLGQASSSKGKGPAGNAGLLKPPTGTTGLSRQERLKQEQAKKLDATVFEYDEVYDDMKEAERATKAAKDELGQERKVSVPQTRPSKDSQALTLLFGSLNTSPVLWLPLSNVNSIDKEPKTHS